MKIICVYGHMFNVNTWSQACEALAADGIDFVLFSQMESADKVVEYMASFGADLFIGQLFKELPGYDTVLEAARKARARAGLGWGMPPDFSTFTEDQMGRFNAYLEKPHAGNYANGVRYLAALCGANVTAGPMAPVQSHGIYHPDARGLFETMETYFSWYRETRPKARGPVVGVLGYFGQIAEKNHDDIDAVIRELSHQDFIPLCVISEGTQDASLPTKDRYPWLAYLTAPKKEDQPRALVNLMAGRLLAALSDTTVLEDLGIPVFQAVRLYQQTPEDWEKDADGSRAGSFSMVYALSQPEMAGVIEPTMLAGTRPERHPGMDVNFRRYIPVGERIRHLCRRIRKWTDLAQMDNKDKRLTIVLNNNPCKGVEATLGMAAGLDTFESLARTIAALDAEGYDVGDAPREAQGLLDAFMDKKAFSEFRWTTVDETVKKGGVLTLMDETAYRRHYDALPQTVRDRVEEDWEPFPGQGMVYADEGTPTLVIAGLTFGKLTLIIQPKRGCYGAKCNGEVCRILHDPNLAPPHHWLATYFYIQDHSDAIVNFGCHGALEFLPGKPSALSRNCFPEVCLGELPHIYPYILDVPAEGSMAKRRGRAVTVTHLTPVYRPAQVPQQMLRLETLLREYAGARGNRETRRQELLEGEMMDLIRELHLDTLGEGTPFDERTTLLSRQLEQFKRTLSPLGMHVLGTAPDPSGTAAMMAVMLMKESDDRPSLADLAALWPAPQTPDENAPDGAEPEEGSREESVFDRAARTLEALLALENETGVEDATAQALDNLPLSFRTWCRKTAHDITQSTREIPQILRALEGRYIEPGISGALALGKTDALPTGRNLFPTDVQALPTRAAWQVGQELSDNLLKKYMADEGRFPESVGLNLWSIDAFKSDGEIFCQILYLMGMRPVWADNGKVTGIEAIPLDDLSLTIGDICHKPRPRVDVVIQTSGILRDMVPHFSDLVDEAAVLASGLDESHEINFIKKHTDEEMDRLRQELGDRYPENHVARMASFRVFSSPPGTYGIGVGLALDASAWETEADLVETYVNWGGYAYGSSRDKNPPVMSGQAAHALYASRLATVDATYMRQYSPEYDILDCGCYASYLGGMSQASKTLGGKSSPIYWGDANTAGDNSIRDVKEDIELSARSRLLNHRWIQNQKDHGFKGAESVSNRVNNLYKWSAVTGKVDKWVFDEVVATYLHNPDNLEWLKSQNPYALEELTRRLLEAQARGLWDADPEDLAAVRNAALEIEGDMEECIGEVDEEYQGNTVDILTATDVEKWKHKWKLGKTDKS